MLLLSFLITAAATDLEVIGERWQDSGRMVLITPERMAAWGDGYDPRKLHDSADFAIDIAPHRPLYCPTIPGFGFCCYIYVGQRPWVPYNGGCEEPDRLGGLTIAPKHVDLVVGTPTLVKGGPTSDSGWQIRIEAKGKEFQVRWRPVSDDDGEWSSLIRMIESPESGVERLRRWQVEQAPKALKKLGASLAGDTLTAGGGSHTVTICRATAYLCDPSNLAVECNSKDGSVLVHRDGVDVRDFRGRGGDACGDSPIPGGG